MFAFNAIADAMHEVDHHAFNAARAPLRPVGTPAVVEDACEHSAEAVHRSAQRPATEAHRMTQPMLLNIVAQAGAFLLIHRPPRVHLVAAGGAFVGQPYIAHQRTGERTAQQDKPEYGRLRGGFGHLALRSHYSTIHQCEKEKADSTGRT